MWQILLIYKIQTPCVIKVFLKNMKPAVSLRHKQVEEKAWDPVNPGSAVGMQGTGLSGSLLTGFLETSGGGRTT